MGQRPSTEVAAFQSLSNPATKFYKSECLCKTSQKTFLVPLKCRTPASTGRGLSHGDTVDLLFDLGKEGGGRRQEA